MSKGGKGAGLSLRDGGARGSPGGAGTRTLNEAGSYRGSGRGTASFSKDQAAGLETEMQQAEAVGHSAEAMGPVSRLGCCCSCLNMPGFCRRAGGRAQQFNWQIGGPMREAGIGEDGTVSTGQLQVWRMTREV